MDGSAAARPGAWRLVEEHRPEILAAASSCGARNIRVFGSTARGQDDDRSDIDFVISLEPGRTLLDIARLEIRLERVLGRRVDVVTDDSLIEPVRSTALKEALPV
jgi:hypothetical protein